MPQQGFSQCTCPWIPDRIYMGVSKNNGTPKSSILIVFSIINHPFWGTPIFGNTHIIFVPFPQLFPGTLLWARWWPSYAWMITIPTTVQDARCPFFSTLWVLQDPVIPNSHQWVHWYTWWLGAISSFIRIEKPWLAIWGLPSTLPGQWFRIGKKVAKELGYIFTWHPWDLIEIGPDSTTNLHFAKVRAIYGETL